MDYDCLSSGSSPDTFRCKPWLSEIEWDTHAVIYRAWALSKGVVVKSERRRKRRKK